ncbi:MAG: hypothetical protein DRQ02_02660 [Candidatus Latescibacterota bacterium]|nr:MAG: hypothetical protein DRQ02_02660 [Candidatus Latescibacterota bacterium]
MPFYRNTKAALLQNQGGIDYLAYSRKVLSYSPIAYWPLWEPSGNDVAQDWTGNGRDGDHLSTVRDSTPIGPAIFCGDASGIVDVYSASLNTAFDGAEGSLCGWARVNAAARWTDALDRTATMLRVDANNRVSVGKPTTNNTFTLRHTAGGTPVVVQHSPFSPSVFFHWGITWSATADEMKAYIDGVQVGGTQTGLGTWAGNLASTTCVIGSYNNTSPGQYWWGWMGHVAVFDTPLPAQAMEALAEM